MRVREHVAGEGREGRAEHVRAFELHPDRLALELPGLAHQASCFRLGLARVGEAGAAPSLLALTARVAEQVVGLVEELPREDAVRVLLHHEVERVLLNPRGDARRMTDAQGPQPPAETERGQVVHRSVARGGAEHALPPVHALGDDLCEHGALAGARRPMDEEEILCAERPGRGLLLFCIQGPLERERHRPVEARRRASEQHLAALAEEPLVPADNGLQPGDRALVGDVVGDALEHEPPLEDEGGGRAVKGDLNSGAGGAGDDAPRGLDSLRATGTHRGDIPGLGGRSHPLLLRPLEGHEDAPTQPRGLLHHLEVEDDQALFLPLLEGEGHRLFYEPRPLRVPLEREQALKVDEEIQFSRHRPQV